MDYEIVSDILQIMSGYYESVLNEVRIDPDYFWVGFYGQSFHVALKVLLL